MNFRRFEHVNQACRNLDATRQFYQLLFPSWFVRAEGEADGMRWLHLGDRQFYLSLYERPDAERTPPSSTGHIDHLGFVIEQGDQMKALLDANRIPYHTELAPETNHRIYLTDPDGTWLELVEYTDTYALK